MKDIAIKENHLYQKAYRNGERANGKHVTVYILRDWGAKKQMLKNPEKKYINRIGLSVSTKIGGAVIRTRVKRLIRAGLAKQGCIPVFGVYSSFLQRGYDMLIHDVSLMGLHVVLGVDRAGLVGEDGETHLGI